ncbi:hypothetical protein EV193_11733 [Herbihabitans rhizosphaerae]|uniref:Terpene synthase family protein n=2 Tax=Herbihabitans rhizosphaerae TaxID=1872711 RepID=A0A4Q7KBL2_9PSEU|nr:hypothetical protein EV193_11733 [Herbihabitans rhizosphaerae]
MFAPAAQCVPLVKLASATLADLRRWTSEHLPDCRDLPLVGVAFGEAVIGPWATADQLRIPARVATWVCAFDDYLEHEITELRGVDEFLERCDAVVRTGKRDDGNPVLAGLSALQRDLGELTGYPALASLWERKFDSCLRGHRYDWIAGWARVRGRAPEAGVKLDVEEYLEHVDSISLWHVQVPRWLAYGGDELPEHLDVLVPAVDDSAVLARLANDLGTIARERSEPGQNNLLMYDGVTEDWVRDEIAGRMAALRRRVAALVAENYPPAVSLIRQAEWTIGVYLGNDLRTMTG